MSKTPRETELEQRTAEYISYVRDYAVNSNNDIVLLGKRDGFRFSLYDKDVTLEFSI